MKTAHLVIHPKSIQYYLDEAKGNKQRELQAQKALKTIESLAEEDKFIIPDYQDPRKFPAELKNYDIILLYGGMHGSCLSTASISLAIEGINNKYAKDGWV